MLPDLIRKFHEAKINDSDTVTIWGCGEPKREFLFSDNLAVACFFLMQNYNGKELINIGPGQDLTIRKLALLLKKIVGF